MARVLASESPSRRLLLWAVAALAVVWTVRLFFWDFSMPMGITIPFKPDETAPDAPASLISPNHTHAILPPEVALNGITDRVAMILDTKYTTHLAPLILHFASVLGPAWPIVFFTSREIRDTHFSGSGDLPALWLRAVRESRIQIVAIPDDIKLTTRDEVNGFLASPWMWTQLAPAKHMLVFQADSIICSNSEHTIEDFLQWDFIGAPFHPDLYNGGLSLRNREMMMETLRERDYEQDMADNLANSLSTGEDVWYAQRIRDMGGKMPSWDTATTFSVEWEHGWYDRPFGYHKVHKTMPDRMDEVREWCPEIELALPNYLKGEEKEKRERRKRRI